MNTRTYQICTKTIMDTSDPQIVFNDKGESDYYTNYIETILPNWHTVKPVLLVQTQIEKFRCKTYGLNRY